MTDEDVKDAEAAYTKAYEVAAARRDAAYAAAEAVMEAELQPALEARNAVLAQAYPRLGEPVDPAALADGGGLVDSARVDVLTGEDNI